VLVVGGRRVRGETVVANLFFFRQLCRNLFVPKDAAVGFVDGDEVSFQFLLSAA
jgi:hypothetical protein